MYEETIIENAKVFNGSSHFAYKNTKSSNFILLHEDSNPVYINKNFIESIYPREHGCCINCVGGWEFLYEIEESAETVLNLIG